MANTFTRILRRIGRATEPLLDPDAADRRVRERAAGKRLDQMTSAAARLAERVQRVNERIDKIDRRQAEHLAHAVSALESAIRSQADFADKVLKR